MGVKIKYNPYAKIDFSNVSQLNSISHEHLVDSYQGIKKAYERGIRHFCIVCYNPSAPTVPLSGWSYQIWDWKNMTPPLEKVFKTWTGSIPSITLDNGRVINTDDLPQVCNAEHDAIPFSLYNWRDRPTHWNTLGCKWATGCNWPESRSGVSRDFRNRNPIMTLKEDCAKNLTPEYQQFKGKWFGTMNHTANVDNLTRCYETAPTFFRAMEVHNQGYSKGVNIEFRNAYDTMLKKGIILFGTSVVDWPGDIEEFGDGGVMTHTEYAYYTKAFSELPLSEQQKYGTAKEWYLQTQRECPNFDRGCNVLLINQSEYDALPHSKAEQERAEYGLDRYIAGEYYASGRGLHRIHRFDVDPSSGKVTFEVSDNPSKIALIHNGIRTETSGNKITCYINEKDKYVRGEAYYYNDKEDMDFIFTNPIFFEVQKDDLTETLLVLGMI